MNAENTEPHFESDDWPHVPEQVSIPPEFHSLEKGGPFRHCMLCEAELFEFHRQYFIERIFRGDEPIVEYAICLDCQEGMCSELSQESQQTMQEFFDQIDYQTRIDRLRPYIHEGDITAWIDACLVTGKKREDCRGYQIVTLCQGPVLPLAVTPFMLSDEALEQIVSLISKHTRDRLEDFLGEHFGMPPEFCEHPDFFPLLI